MAGAGLKTFATGDVLTASDVNTYLMQQTITVFDTATARDAAITSPSEGMFSYTITTPAETLSYYDGSSWTATTLAADITSIVTAAASGLSGGATSGAVTLTLNLAGLTAAQNFGADGAGVDVTFHSTTSGDYSMWDASEEKWILEGTNGATVLDITDGNVVIGDGTLTVGSDGAGEDVTFYSDTAGDSMVWDSSAESLTITGTNGQDALVVADGDVSITDALTVTGTTTTYLNVITDSGTTRTPALTDASAYILCTHGSGMTVTLPQDSAVAFPTGSQIVFERNGAGTLTFAAGTGATVNSKGSTLTCADRYTTIAAVKIAADTWTIFGNIG